MKRCLAVSLVFIVVLFAGGAFAAQPLGGPAEANQHKVAISVSYFYSLDR
jgi:hypothetical protein